MSSVRRRRWLHVELHFDVLAHLDLGQDAASIFDPRRSRPAWAAPLLDAYRAAPGRIWLQGLPLLSDDLASYLEALRGPSPGALGDPEGRRLCALFLEALAERRPIVEGAARSGDVRHVPQGLGVCRENHSRRRIGRSDPVCVVPPPPNIDRTASSARLAAGASPVGPDSASLRRHGSPSAARLGPGFSDTLPGQIDRLRHALWAGRAPPALEILDCAALLRQDGGSHGRAAFVRGGRRVAVSLDARVDQLLCQLLHEEAHAVTDPPIRARAASAPRDTRAGSPGFALHRELEEAAVAAGEAVVVAELPSLLPAYHDWRSRHGV